MIELILGFFMPFLGTCLGSMMVFFLKDNISAKFEKLLVGFASGIMLSASIWSLLVPALEQSSNLGQFAWLPVVVGFLIGVVFLLVVEIISENLMKKSNGQNYSNKTKSSMMLLAINIHNIPEGLAVGVALAGSMANSSITISAGLILAIGIAIQNFPDGAIVSLPLYASGMSKAKAFWLGVVSGLIELISCVIAFFLTEIFVPILPYVLAFAGGATIFVVVKDLIPGSQTGDYNNLSIIAFAIGFVLMFILDVALG